MNAQFREKMSRTPFTNEPVGDILSLPRRRGRQPAATAKEQDANFFEKKVLTETKSLT